MCRHLDQTAPYAPNIHIATENLLLSDSIVACKGTLPISSGIATAHVQLLRCTFLQRSDNPRAARAPSPKGRMCEVLIISKGVRRTMKRATTGSIHRLLILRSQLSAAEKSALFNKGCHPPGRLVWSASPEWFSGVAAPGVRVPALRVFCRNRLLPSSISSDLPKNCITLTRFPPLS